MTRESVLELDNGLQELLMGEWEDAAIFLTLANRLEGSRAETLLRRLYTEEQAHADYLKGLCVLRGLQPLTRIIPEAHMPPEEILRLCYGRQMRRLAAYEARSRYFPQGEFTRLALQEREHCQQILELIRKLKRKANT